MNDENKNVEMNDESTDEKVNSEDSEEMSDNNNSEITVEENSDAESSSEEEISADNENSEADTVDDGVCKKNKKLKIIIVIAVLLAVLCGTFGILYGTKVICFHSEWSETTCTDPETCIRCGETKGEPLGHDWAEADCENPETCKVCGETEGEPLGHDWTEADCENPKTCKVCGKTEGDPLEHKWKNATCENPKTCELCGKTEGKTLEHKWKDATCEKPKTCELCGKTEGKAKGHEWTEATCEKPKTCKVCKKTSGSSLGHDYQKGYCSRCDAKDPDFTFITDITTISELEEYLNKNYSSIDTPYGNIPVKIEIEYPTTNTEKSLFGYDMYIKCGADFMIHNADKKITEYDWVLMPWDLDSINVTDSERQEIVNIMKDYQKSIADDAMTAFPSSFIMGGFYDFTSSGWTITDDYANWHDSDIDRYFTWTNFIGRRGEHSYYDSYYREDMTLAGFGWAPDGDDKWYGYND